MYIWVTEVYNHHFIYSVEFKAFIRSADTKEDGCCDRLALTSTALTGFFAKYLGKVMSKGPPGVILSQKAGEGRAAG